MTELPVPKFKIGDRVFMSSYDRGEKYITCPDCGGSQKVRMILADDTEIHIECGGCDPGGYRGSTGKVKQYEFSVVVTPYTVTGVKASIHEVEYELDNFGGCAYRIGKNDNLFPDEQSAMAGGEIKKLEHEAEENKRLLSKTKDAKSWAWNATYHRKCIKDAETQLAYHRSKVQVCAAKAKESA